MVEQGMGSVVIGRRSVLQSDDLVEEFSLLEEETFFNSVRRIKVKPVLGWEMMPNTRLSGR